MILKNKKVCFFLLILIVFQIGFALDTQATFHFDTYSGENIYGASFNFFEPLTNHLALNAALDYKLAKNYLAYCTCNINFPRLEANAGVIYDINDLLFAPGFTFLGKYELTKNISFKGTVYTTFFVDNVFKIYSVDATGSAIFTTKNTIIELTYEYLQKTKDTTKEWEHHGGLLIQGFDIESPIQIDVFADFSFEFTSADSSYMNIAIDAGSTIYVKTEKAGTYYVTGSVEAYNQVNTTSAMPFSVATGVKLKL